MAKRARPRPTLWNRLTQWARTAWRARTGRTPRPRRTWWWKLRRWALLWAAIVSAIYGTFRLADWVWNWLAAHPW